MKYRQTTVFVLVFCFGALLPAFALAESWVAIPSASPNVLFTVDETSLVRDGNVAKFWERLVFVVPQQRDEPSGKMVKEKRIHRVMNCAEKTQGYLYTSLIAADGRQIEAVYHNESNVEMKLIAARSVAEKELDWVCADARKSKKNP